MPDRVKQPTSSIEKSHLPDDFQDVPSYVSAMSMFAARGETIGPHEHPRAQLALAVSGVMEVDADGRHWLVPPQRALWVPSGISHKMRARTDVALRNVYVREKDTPFTLPSRTTLLPVSPLLRELIVRAVVTPIEDDMSGHAASLVDLLLSELRFASPDVSFSTPNVSDPRLKRIEAVLRHDPGNTATIEDWAALACMSSRNLNRKIHDETSMSFSDWRRQIRLNDAIVRLVEGDTVTSVALSLGYENIGSFSRMFRKVMGLTPTDFASAS